MVSRLVLVFLSWTMVASAYGLTYQKAYQILSEQGESLSFSHGNHGALCEVLAQAKMKEIFPYSRIESGIKYGPYGGSIKGELDVVVFSDSRPTMIIEVKCSRKFSSAAAKADQQLSRFSGVAGECGYRYWGAYLDYDCEDFQGEKSYHKMSYTDAMYYGFDLSFDLSRGEILSLIDELSY